MYKLTKTGEDEFGNDFWYMEPTEDSVKEIDENVEYLDIPPMVEINKKWEERLLSILPKLK